MSIKIMSEIWANGPDSQGDLLVLLALADFADDEGRCWPAMASIAKKARIEERSARRVIRRLEEAGWLSVAVGNGRHGCSEYTIKPGQIVPRTESPPDTPAPKPGPQGPETRTAVSPEPSRTTKEPSVKRKTRVNADAVISDDQIRIAVKEGVSEREAIAQFSAFKDGALANDRRYADWDAAWRNWLRSPYFKPITTGASHDNRTPRQSHGRPSDSDAVARRLAFAAATPRSPNPNWQ